MTCVSLRATGLFIDSRNRLLPRFINKATTAEPIQGDEKILLQSRSKINMKVHGNQNLPPKIPTQDLTKSELHDDAPKRVTTHRAIVVETSRSRVFTRSLSAEKVTTTVPSKGL
jgi:hypothetical protein